METTTKVLIGVGVVAAGLAVVGIAAAASSPSSASPSTPAAPGLNQAIVAATGPYAPLTQQSTLQPGSTYLVSVAAPPGVSAAQVVAASPAALGAIPPGLTSLAGLGFTVNQAWAPGTVPSNWPATDGDATRARASITYTGSVPVPISTVLSAMQAYVAAGGQLTGVTMFSTGS